MKRRTSGRRERDKGPSNLGNHSTVAALDSPYKTPVTMTIDCTPATVTSIAAVPSMAPNSHRVPPTSTLQLTR